MLNTSPNVHGQAQATPPSLHKYDWLKESRVTCPKCESNHVMAVRRTWYQRMVTWHKKFWCQDCGKVFWKKY